MGEDVEFALWKMGLAPHGSISVGAIACILKALIFMTSHLIEKQSKLVENIVIILLLLQKKS